MRKFMCGFSQRRKGAKIAKEGHIDTLLSFR